MPNKKDPEPPQKPEEQALQQRVDAMMDPRQPAPSTAKPAAGTKTPPPIDIFKDTPAADVTQRQTSKTAPIVPTKLLQQNKIKAITEPLSESSTTASPPAPGAAETAPAASDPVDAPYSDPATDQAVDDIAANEGDAILAAEDAATRPSREPAKSDGWKAKLARLLKNKWTWIGLAVLLIIILAVPFTRYKLLGLVVKKPVTLTVIDSKTDTPVSNATISVNGGSIKTDANGKANLKVALGRAALRVTKQYYKTYSGSFFVGFQAAHAPNIHLIATGRQVSITVLNKISGKPLANAEIKVLHTTAKTNAHGQAVVVLPTSNTSDNATLALNGYNTAAINVQVTSSVVSGNTFTLTPSGHLYFLSNLSGTIDVVKTNLDGTGRQTVLAGTGKEDPNTTSLLASRDWHYLVLKAQRDTGRPALYLIDTSNDKTAAFDNSNATFNLIGWYDHNFVYDLLSNTVAQSQTGHEVIKGYDADHAQLNQLDQDQAEGSAASYAYQGFGNFYVLSNRLAYTTQWYTYDSTGTGYDISSKSDTIRTVQPTGQSKKDYQSFPTSGLGYIQATLYKPQAIYYAVYNNSNNTTAYYNFDGQTVTTATSLNQSTFAQTYPTYLISPSGNQSFWADQRDGKNVLFIGNADAQNQKQIGSLTGYAAYGWYSDNYVLASQDSSQLYIMPAGGLAAGHQPLKVSGYYKPPQTYSGYGYGYGGL